MKISVYGARQAASGILVALALAVLPAAADCGSDCSDSCDALDSAPEWATCMETCLDRCLANDPPDVPDVPPPTPVEEETGDAKSVPESVVPQAPDAPVLAQTAWRFVEALGAAVPPAAGATLAFAADGAAAGALGCNSFTASYAAAGADLALSGISSTKMMCEPERMTVEIAIQSALKHTRHVAEAEGELRLVASDGSILARLVH